METTTNTLILYQHVVTTTGQIIQDSLPMLWLFIGLGIALLVTGIIIKTFHNIF